ncbi:MAG TPA: transposase [Pyrinomonadaceae bacterium]|jgi:REP element-mobilizing transposase RayT|nr:transposase [Pyrinomonadaceae bacterium]
MWNDSDMPLAFLFTFRCYGTWLHGDGRGSIDRLHNRYQSPYLPPDERRMEQTAHKLKGDPVTLNAAHRAAVDNAIRETCYLRGWLLRAVNVRTNHVHVVVSIGNAKPEQALNAFKANATRRMRQDGFWTRPHSPWADKGSTRYLWNELSIERAVEYVVDGQGAELPDFD